ncbi:hypothetical protein Bca52824_065962 [Brassica carinata]|nr:hypothetical protein Bca52824_065962 [Brassica carinata]
MATNNDNGRSKDFGFVQYDNEESALKAISYLSECFLTMRRIVGPFLQKDSPYDKGFFTDISSKISPSHWLAKSSRRFLESLDRRRTV